MRTVMAKQDPGRVDLIHRRAGAALREAVGSPKRLGRVAGISDRLAQYWTAGHPGNPTARAAEVVAAIAAAGHDPWPVISHLKAEAMTVLMQHTGDDAAVLARRVKDAMKAETQAQAELDVLEMAFDPAAPDLSIVRRARDAALRHAARCEHLAAVLTLLERRLEEDETATRA